MASPVRNILFASGNPPTLWLSGVWMDYFMSENNRAAAVMR
jgi:hypothetical protein